MDSFAFYTTFMIWGGLMFRRLFMSAVALTVIFGGFGVVYGGALEPGYHYTWGINNPQAIDLASGRIITEAVLTFHNFNSSVKDQVEAPSARSSFKKGTTTTTTLTDIPNYDSLSIYVLDNPRYGFQSLGSFPVDPFVGCGGKLIKGVLEQVDSERYNLICRLGDTHSDNSPFSSLFNAPVALTLAGGSSVVLSSALLEFIDYAGTGPSAGFGLWPGNVQYSYDDITLTLTVGAYQGDSTAQTLTFRIGDDMNPIGENPVQPEPEVFYTLDVFAANGTIAKSPNLTSYAQGDLVTLTATAAADYTFSHWSGDASGTNSSVTVTMDADKSVTANFTQNAAPTYTVTFNLDGKGTRTGGGALVQTIAHGAAATAPTVAASTGWVFTGWDKTFNNVTGNLTINAQYTAQTYTLNITSASGSVIKRVNGVITTATSFAHGTVVSLTAVADTGYTFGNWSGGVTGTANPISITMDGNKSVTANYTQNAAQTYTLAITATNGSVTVKINGVVTTATSFEAGTVVELTAAADSGYTFGGWSGGVSGTANPVLITMNGNKSVTAAFSVSRSSFR